MKRLWFAVVAISAGLGATPAVAVDGVKLLGQPRPSAFPITISAPGSYRLRSNITVPDENTTAIVVATNDVTIDLNGFSILGPTTCTGSPTVTSCAPLGTGNGIDAAGRQSVSVMNGTIRGMGNHGITLDDGSVDQVKAVSNGAAGIIRISGFSWFTSIVSRCMANSNGTNGIYGLGVVSDSTANFNGQTGIFATAAVSSCGAIENGGIGILAPSATVHNSTARSNDGAGINAHVITNSMASNNSGIGISGSAASGCAATGNAGGQVITVGIAGQNLCGGTPCP
jgi:hypothetical protein